MMRIFSWFGKRPASNEVTDNSDESVIREHELRQQKKSAWEADNNLKKKRDAAYLHTSHTAFNGSYEEFMETEYIRKFMTQGPLVIDHRQQMSAIGYNPYQNYGISNCGWSGLLGNIIGL